MPVYGIGAVPSQLILHIPCPAYPSQSSISPSYKFYHDTLVMSALTLTLTFTLLENGFTLPWKLSISVAPAYYWIPKTNRVLLLLPGSSQ